MGASLAVRLLARLRQDLAACRPCESATGRGRARVPCRRRRIWPKAAYQSGTGVPNLFDNRDAVIACVLADLRAAGVSLELRFSEMRHGEPSGCNPSFYGPLKVLGVEDRLDAAQQAQTGGDSAAAAAIWQELADAVSQRLDPPFVWLLLENAAGALQASGQGPEARATYIRLARERLDA
jgi:hypothetical protein